jgi:hypothetical protein
MQCAFSTTFTVTLRIHLSALNLCFLGFSSSCSNILPSTGRLAKIRHVRCSLRFLCRQNRRDTYRLLPQAWDFSHIATFCSLFSTLARMMRMFSSMSSLPEAKCRHRASKYVQRRCQDDMVVIERRRRLNSTLALHGGGTGATPINAVSALCCSQHTYNRRSWGPRE